MLLGPVKSYQYFFGTAKISVTEKKKFIIILIHCVTWIVISSGTVYLNKRCAHINRNEERKQGGHQTVDVGPCNWFVVYFKTLSVFDVV